MRNHLTAGLSLVAAALALALPLGLGQPAGAQDKPFKLGMIYPTGGQLGEYVQQQLVRASNQAIAEVNAKGGILGHPVEGILEETKAEATSAVSSLHKLLDVDKVQHVLTVMTPLVLPMLPIADERKIFVGAIATEHPEIPKSKWAWRLSAPADAHGKQAARTALEMGLKSVAIIYEENEALRVGVQAFQATFEQGGGEVPLVETFRPEATDVRSQLTKLRLSGADGLYLYPANGRAMAVVLKQMGEVGYDPEQILTTGLIEDREVVEAVPKAIEGAVYTTFYLDPEFKAAWHAKNGYDITFVGAKYYDAVWFLKQAIEKAGTTDPATVRDALYKMTFSGVSGNYTFDGNGQPDTELIVNTVKNGKFVRYQP